MSHKASAWAMDQSPNTILEKLVLIILADCHNEASGHCYPSITYLATKAMCSRRGAMKAIESLENQGYISSRKNAGRVTYYTINRDRTGEPSAPVVAIPAPVVVASNRCTQFTTDPCTQFTGEHSAPVNTVHATGEHSAPPLVNWTTPTGEHSAPEPGINRELNREENRGRGEQAHARPLGHPAIQSQDTVVHNGNGYVVTEFWEPSEAARAMCIRAGVPERIFANPETIGMFRLKYSQAHCRDPAFDKRYVSWCVNEHRNPRHDANDHRNTLERQTDDLLGIDRRFFAG